MNKTHPLDNRITDILFATDFFPLFITKIVSFCSFVVFGDLLRVLSIQDSLGSLSDIVTFTIVFLHTQMSAIFRSMGRVAPRVTFSTNAMMRAVAANCGIVNFESASNSLGSSTSTRSSLGVSAPMSVQFAESAICINLDGNDPGMFQCIQ